MDINRVKDEHFKLGDRAYKEQEYAEAILLYSKVDCAIFDFRIAANYNISVCYLKLGNLYKSIDLSLDVKVDFEKHYLTLREAWSYSTYYSNLFNLSLCYFRTGDMFRALYHAKECKTINDFFGRADSDLDKIIRLSKKKV